MPPQTSPPTPSRVDQLIEAMARQEAGSLEALEREFGGPMRAVATRFTGSDADGEEVVQDTLLKAWRAAAKFDPTRGNGKSWLYTILRNTARDSLRRRRIRWLAGFDELMEELPDDAPSSDQALHARQELAAVRQAMGDLPDRQRMALLLASVAGLETPEIAGILGTSRGATEQLLVRARARLRAMIGRQTP